VSPWRASSLFEFKQPHCAAHFSQRLHFNLANPFTREPKCTADLFECQPTATTVPAVEARRGASELTGSIVSGQRRLARRYAQNVGIVHDFFHHQKPFNPQNQVPGSGSLPSVKPWRLAIA